MLQTIGRLRAPLREGSERIPVLILSAFPVDGLAIQEMTTLRRLERRKGNLQAYNEALQGQARLRIQAALKELEAAGEAPSRRAVARKAGVSLTDAVRYCKETTSELPQALPSGAIRKEGMMGYSRTRLGGNTPHSSEPPANDVLTAPPRKHRCQGCPAFEAYRGGSMGSRRAARHPRPSAGGRGATRSDPALRPRGRDRSAPAALPRVSASFAYLSAVLMTIFIGGLSCRLFTGQTAYEDLSGVGLVTLT